MRATAPIAAARTLFLAARSGLALALFSFAFICAQTHTQRLKVPGLHDKSTVFKQVL